MQRKPPSLPISSSTPRCCPARLRITPALTLIPIPLHPGHPNSRPRTCSRSTRHKPLLPQLRPQSTLPPPRTVSDLERASDGGIITQRWQHRGWGRMLGWGGWSQGHFLSPWGPSAQSCSRFRRSWSWPGPNLMPSPSELVRGPTWGPGAFADLGICYGLERPLQMRGREDQQPSGPNRVGEGAGRVALAGAQAAHA